MTSNASAGSVLVVGRAADSTFLDGLENRGVEMIECPGPEGTGRCPLVETGRCSLVDRADGIVMGLDLTVPLHRSILGCYRERSSMGPIAVLTDHEVGLRDLDDVDVTGSEPSEREIESFASRVELAASARQALSELAGLARGF